MKNEDAAKEADVVVIAIPAQYLIDFLKNIGDYINKEALIISPIVPINKKDGKFIYDPTIIAPNARSAGEVIARTLKNRVVSSFHTLPAKKLADPYSML